MTVDSFARFWCCAITSVGSWRKSLDMADDGRAAPVKIMGFGSGS